MLYRYCPLLSTDAGGQVRLADNCTNGVAWILQTFGDCVDTNLKLSGFAVCVVSLLLWLVQLFPQLYENYRTKRCEGLSVFFLLFWLTGDVFNMIGAALTHQQPLQQIIAAYYCLQDGVLLSQFIYYSRMYQQTTLMTGSTIVVPVLLFGFVGISQFWLPLLSTDSVEVPPTFESYSAVVGYALGSSAALCYLASPIPQLLRNYRRKSCEGLSLAMFCICVLANLTYGLSVLLESTQWSDLLRHLPWLAGSLGPCFFDVCVIGQYYYYERKNATRGAVCEDHEALLEDGDQD